MPVRDGELATELCVEVTCSLDYYGLVDRVVREDSKGAWNGAKVARATS